MPEPTVVNIEVHGQKYPIKTSLDPEYVHQLAAVVDQRMRKAADTAPSSDTLGLAILAALNIADELRRASDQRVSDSGSLAERTAALERIVDQALALAE
jgi:cell division protein ZapA